MNSSVGQSKLDDKEHLSESRTPHTETLPEKVEASVRGEDEPMEREHPRAPGAMVLFSYPLALLAILIVGALVIMIFW